MSIQLAEEASGPRPGRSPVSDRLDNFRRRYEIASKIWNSGFKLNLTLCSLLAPGVVSTSFSAGLVKPLEAKGVAVMEEVKAGEEKGVTKSLKFQKKTSTRNLTPILVAVNRVRASPYFWDFFLLFPMNSLTQQEQTVLASNLVCDKARPAFNFLLCRIFFLYWESCTLEYKYTINV